jgi:histidinol phosphatase-like enzyme
MALKKKRNVLVCIDRDDTLIYDHKYFLGHTDDWRKKVKIMKGVVAGLKLLNNLPNCSLYMISNQSGIAIFPTLTAKRATEVCKYVISILRKKGGHINGFIFSQYVTPDYVKRHPQYHFDPKHVKDDSWTKPHSGMIREALRRKKWTRKNTTIYSIGDRVSDVQSALNIGGFGVLVPAKTEPHQIEKTQLLMKKHKNIYIAHNFLDAARFIVKRESQISRTA